VKKRSGMGDQDVTKGGKTGIVEVEKKGRKNAKTCRKRGPVKKVVNEDRDYASNEWDWEEKTLRVKKKKKGKVRKTHNSHEMWHWSGPSETRKEREQEVKLRHTLLQRMGGKKEKNRTPY